MARFFYAGAILGVLLMTASCGASITQPGDHRDVSAPLPEGATTYRATLTASPACADKLPEAARKRTYDVTVYANGNIKWEGTTLHAIVVTGSTLSDSSFTFSLGDSNHVNAEDSESIRDQLESGTLLIWGKAAGTLQDTLITGEFDGAFSFLTGTASEAETCKAQDHRFTFVRQ